MKRQAVMIKIPKNVQEITTYKPGKTISEIRRDLNVDVITKLGSNENSLGTSPLALEAITKSLEELHWYPEPACIDIRRKFADYNKVQLENIVVGNGSEGVLSYIFKAFMEPGEELLTSEGTFIGVYVLAQVNNIKVNRIAQTIDYGFDLDAIKASISAKTKMIYLANPNNPTGTVIKKKEFEAFMADIANDILVVLDEAYYEYAVELESEYPVGSTYDYENLISLRTFSKAYGLGGMRIGYGIGPAYLIEELMKVKLPFEPSIVAQAAGIGAIDDTDFLNRTIAMNNEGIIWMLEELKDLSLKTSDSVANFVMVDLDTAERVNKLNTEMLKRGVIIRPLPAFGLPHCFRITIGTMEENKRCINAIKEILPSL